MSQILRAPVSFLTAIASAAYSANLRLYYATSPTSGISPASNAPVAVGAAAAAFVSPGTQTLTGLPNPGPGTSPPVPNRSWRLVIPASQAVAAGLNLERDIEINEECACQAAEPNSLLQLGFTPYTPTTAAPIPAIYG